MNLCGPHRPWSGPGKVEERFEPAFVAGKVKAGAMAGRALLLALWLAPAWCFTGSPRRQGAHAQANSIPRAGLPASAVLDPN